MTIRKIKASLVKIDIDDYLCEDTYLFYDVVTGCIRIADGTVGGKPACIEGLSGAVNWGSILGNIDLQLDLIPRIVEHSQVTIAAGATSILMSTAPSDNLGVKYIVSVVDTVNDRFAASEVMGTYKAIDSSVSHNQYNILGDDIDYTPNVTFTSPDVELKVTNNDVNPITVTVTRIPTLSI